jgi:hypothetical protein
VYICLRREELPDLFGLDVARQMTKDAQAAIDQKKLFIHPTGAQLRMESVNGGAYTFRVLDKWGAVMVYPLDSVHNSPLPALDACDRCACRPAPHRCPRCDAHLCHRCRDCAECQPYELLDHFDSEEW